MNRRTTFTLTTMALPCLAAALPTRNEVAQENQRVSYKTSADSTEVRATNVDVEDVPNHVVRVYDVHRAHRNGPMINGVRLVEEFARGTTDVTDNNGFTVGYGVYVMETATGFLPGIYRSTRITRVRSPPRVSGLLQGARET